MNRQDLSSQLKQATENLDKILDAAQLPTDLQEFTPEQIEALEAIAQLVETKQAKTYKEAGEIYRKPIREAQLQEIAFRHTISSDRIPEILTAMKLKPETLRDDDLTHFESVCQQIHAGIDFDMAIQSVAPSKQTKAKAAKAKPMPEFAPPQDGEEKSGAIAKADRPVTELVVQDVEFVNQNAREQIDAVVKAVGPLVATDYVEVVTEEAIAIDQGIRHYARHALYRSIAENPRAQGTPEDAVELFKQKQAERAARRNDR
ncbi:MAG: hypothetical protein HC852_11255 [Acaryochloridaceae cyanobacterium RU_4_10]|nr:hypothetical protein [Acaryochloridaceae cyanobacterium RU_4_10]